MTTISMVTMTPDLGAMSGGAALLQPVVPSGAPQHAGYGASLGDVGAFDRALARAAVQPPGAAMQALFRPLEFINAEAASLSTQAGLAADAGRTMTPGELLQLSVKCQEFMFHCQLTSNAANRTSDGLQQLFRQQA